MLHMCTWYGRRSWRLREDGVRDRRDDGWGGRLEGGNTHDKDSHTYSILYSYKKTRKEI